MLIEKINALVSAIATDIKSLYQRSLPTSGTSGQVLVKTSTGVDYKNLTTNDITDLNLSGFETKNNKKQEITPDEVNSYPTNNAVIDFVKLGNLSDVDFNSLEDGHVIRYDAIDSTYKTSKLSVDDLNDDGVDFVTVINEEWNIDNTNNDFGRTIDDEWSTDNETNDFVGSIDDVWNE